MPEIRTRFSPSPTGFLHIGSVRTVIFAYLFAKSQNGKFVLRIEDTDQKREVPGSVENIIQTIQWLGIQVDEGPHTPGPYGPYTQSKRLDIYNVKIQVLLENKTAYKCFCSKERLDKVRETQMANKQAPKYDEHCRNLTAEQVKEQEEINPNYVIRQKIPKDQIIEFNDSIKGKMRFESNTLDDHVLMKSDGFPTYHFAVVVDDNHMQISHVIRADEWLPSTPKHILLYQDFKYKVPQFAHVPPVLKEDGRKKLSKRDGNASMEDYIKQGYTKNALFNFLALLGWNPGTKQELFTTQELIKEFDLKRVQKSGAILDIQKLNWFNLQHKRLSLNSNLTDIAMEINPNVEITEPRKGQKNFQFANSQEFLEFNIKKGNLLENYLPANLIKELENQFQSKDYLYKALSSLEDQILKDPSKIQYSITIFNKDIESYNLDLFQHEKMQVDTETAKNALTKTLEKLQEEDFASPSSLLEKFKLIISELGYKNGQVLWPVRVALSNQAESPGVFELAYALSYQKSMDRIRKALNNF